MRIIAITFVLLAYALPGFSQWSFNGSNIYNTNTGNVGIGTSTPSYSLEIRKTTYTEVLANCYSSNLPGASFRTSAGISSPILGSFESTPLITSPNGLIAGVLIGSRSNHPVGFMTNGNTQMFLTTDGKLGIGTMTPNETLEINGSIRGDQSGALRISSGFGYVDIGAKNTSWAHFYTDRPGYYFDKQVRVDGGAVGSFNSDLSLQTSGTTRIYVLNSNGNVGINNTAPGYTLDVTGTIRASSIKIATTSNVLKGTLYQNGSDGFGLLDGDGNWGLRLERDNYTSFLINNSEKMRILSSGNVGIGTTAPSELLDVNGTMRLRSVPQDNTLTKLIAIDTNGKVWWRDPLH